MTDQIYYKIQYPLKKAITVIKQVDPEEPFSTNNNSQEDREEIRIFLDKWENEGEAKIKDLIKKLRDSK